MEVKINTVQIITANNDFASLEAIETEVYQYRFTVSISKTAVQNSYATNLVVRTYKENPKNQVSTSIFDKSSQTLNVLNQNARNIIQRIQRRAFATTTKITETRNNILTKNSYGLYDLIAKFNNGVGYTVISDKAKSAVRNDVYANSNTINQQELNEDRTVSQLSLDLLNRFNIDPAEAIKRVFAGQTAYESNNGLVSNSNNQFEVLYEENKILASLLANNNFQNTPDAVVQTYSVSERDIINIHIDVAVPTQAVGTDDFYIMLSVYDTKSSLIQEFVKLVPHKTNVIFFQKPSIPPALNITKYQTGELAMTVKQFDPHGTGIKVYKTVYSPTVNSAENEQVYVGSFDLPAGETRTYTIQNESVGLLLFRAVSYNANADTSSDFSSAIVLVNPEEANVFGANNFLSLKTSYTRDGLNITISDIPNDVAFLKLYRTNLTVDPYAEILLTTFYIAGLGKAASYAYLDIDLDKYKSYRYRCTIVDIKGLEYNSSAMVELYYRPQTQDYAVTTYTAPNINPIQLPGRSTQYYDVSFNVSYAITNKLEDNVKQFLINQGLIQYYGASIQRERLKDLLVTKVELRNQQTNDKYFLGYIDSTFQQSTTKFGLLDESAKYTYELTTYVRNPATLLQSLVASGSSTPRTSGKLAPTPYSYVPFNVNHPFGLLQGINPQKSGNEFVTQFGLDQLEFGDVTGIDYIDVDLKPPSPVVNDFRAMVFNSKNVELTWSVNGDQSRISHFIIRRQNIITGKLDLVGRAHGINIQNKFLYIDPIRYTETGVFRYIITMQYFDMNLSTDYVSNQVVI